MKRYTTSKEFYEFAAVTTFVVMGIVGTIVFYSTTKLPVYVALLSIVLGALSGIGMGGIVTVGDKARHSNKIDFLKLLISFIFWTLPYLGISYLIARVDEPYNVIPLALSGMLAGVGLYLLIWQMKHGWNSKRE
ncbi:MAG: hypothetical protein K8R25_14175 [Methanosarcinales archaeon]|nr:hypothetical protein [Methanosarcinales archaeon]